MEANLWEWLRASRSRVDLSGAKVTVSAFANEQGLSVNASGATFAEAVRSCKEKVEKSEQIAAAARALFTKAVNRSYHMLLNKEAVDEADQELLAAKKDHGDAQKLLAESSEIFKTLSADRAGLEARLELNPDDELIKSELEASIKKVSEAKERYTRHLSIADAFKKNLESAESKKVNLIKFAKQRARLTGDAKKYKEYLVIMGRWNDDE